jgi:hypothetical protein
MRLCRYITRPALANERLERDGAGNVVQQSKNPWRAGATDIAITPAAATPAQARFRTRPRTLRAVWRRAPEHGCDRRAGGDRRDPRAPGLAGTRATALAGAPAGVLPRGLIVEARTVLRRGRR